MFNIKRFKISGIDCDMPVKTFDAKNIRRESRQIAKNENFQFSEVSKTTDARKIQDLCKTSDNGIINGFFGEKPMLNLAPDVVNLTFKFNPYDHFSNIDEMSGFFDLYYEHSKTLLTVPNIKIKTNNIPIISISKYLEFVDSAFDVLNIKNHKPIFVPISLKTSQNDVEEICTHYLNKEYFNFWVDFDGSAISSNTLARIRHLFRILKNKGRFQETLCYFTNIKREISSNTKFDKSPASDILASVAGANIIGVNREPSRPFNTTITPQIIQHKNRILDRKTYYYNKTPANLSKDINIIQNSAEIKKELKEQTEIILRDSTILDHIKNKPMLVNKSDIFKSLTEKQSKPIDSWF